MASIIVGLIGAAFVLCGYLIWKKEKISLLHAYHYDKVTAENKKAFCTLSGVGVLLIGVGLLLTAILIGLTDSPWSFLAFMIGFAAGLSTLVYAGKRYNGEI